MIYVLKENRTYDQILGDLKVGDGDPSLTMYGEDITPNEHKLALQFGVLDNFYDSGEVSGDGHVWSTAAITSDYNEKTWQIAYRGKERTYDFQGQDRRRISAGAQSVRTSTIRRPDSSGTTLRASHVSYRVYGEFVNAEWCNEKPKAANPKQGTPSGQGVGMPAHRTWTGRHTAAECRRSAWWTQPVAVAGPFVQRREAEPRRVLRDHFDPLYPDFNTDYPDQLRADEFLNEFGAYVRAREAHEGAAVRIAVVRPAVSAGRPHRWNAAEFAAPGGNRWRTTISPLAASSTLCRTVLYWDDTAIFVLEDDAQDGADHVDAHRSTAFVISKYSPGSVAQPYVEHRFYTTVNMIHTMELLLGLPPMNQNDAYAPSHERIVFRAR